MSAEESKPEGFNRELLASELDLGRVYLGLVKWSAGDGSRCGWWVMELVRIEDGVYRRFRNNVEDSHKLYRTFKLSELGTTTLFLQDK